MKKAKQETAAQALGAERVMMKLAYNLEALMHAKGVTSSVLAALMRVERARVLAILSGSPDVPWTDVVIAFAALGMDVKAALVRRTP